MHLVDVIMHGKKPALRPGLDHKLEPLGRVQRSLHPAALEEMPRMLPVFISIQPRLIVLPPGRVIRVRAGERTDARLRGIERVAGVIVPLMRLEPVVFPAVELADVDDDGRNFWVHEGVLRHGMPAAAAAGTVARQRGLVVRLVGLVVRLVGRKIRADAAVRHDRDGGLEGPVERPAETIEQVARKGNKGWLSSGILDTRRTIPDYWKFNHLPRLRMTDGVDKSLEGGEFWSSSRGRDHGCFVALLAQRLCKPCKVVLGL
ncbi:hypothetical protein CONLIGDRAFT_337220 [Coniochaeta ligniaria NRRL 30616]|uniref:Uncharacterized protein n=1 Tax=Coniochaeta ligniaria NRRL 30616 TaxID=1408157 RepID=A0A1J7JIS2_9PEZI|nr:hypothetical protein CONLIGDRAFT_337220 [Coniochaeta ligniaria NRRL 30616]